MSSLRDSRSREDEASSISSGATVTIPNASDASQCCQVARIGASAL